VLRQEFATVKPQPYSQRNSLLLIFGGSDPCHLTLPLLQLFDSYSVDFPITVITGGGYQHLAELKLLIDSTKLTVEHHHDCQHLAPLMAKSRLAISGAGGSQFELQCCATPSILVVVAQNQLFASQQAKRQGWCEVLEYQQESPESSLNQMANAAINLWQQPEVLETMYTKANAIPCESGVQSILKQMYS
jgi:spore coat polysaccharide biosynthesis predicted glycosyltransferase SpsG